MNKELNNLNEFLFNSYGEYLVHDELCNINTTEFRQELINLATHGFLIDNSVLFVGANLKEVCSDIIKIGEKSIIEGRIFRPNFLKDNLFDYSEQDWEAIIAQYSLTYGWSEMYSCLFGSDANSVLENYRLENEQKSRIDISGNKLNVISLVNNTKLFDRFSSSLESSVALSSDQREFIKLFFELYPDDCLSMVKDGWESIVFKENRLFIMDMIYKISGEYPFEYVNTSMDMLRSIVYSFCKYSISPSTEPLVNFTKNELKLLHIHISNSNKKKILARLDEIFENQKDYQNTEDMLAYKQFWKRLDKYLNYEKKSKQIKRYPNFYSAVLKLYEKNPWTFNARLETAKVNQDYLLVAQILSEKPGVFMRNIFDLLRKKAGDFTPVKETSNSEPKEIKRDATSFFTSEAFNDILRSTNTKLLWTVLIELQDERLYKDITIRVTNGSVVNYKENAPYKGINSLLSGYVQKNIIKELEHRLHDKNTTDSKKYYIDPDVQDYIVPMTDRNSVCVSMTGDTLAPGTILTSDLSNKIRFGVAWRGEQSTDVDLSSLFISDNETATQSYTNPVLKHDGFVYSVSSGDITSSSYPEFSVEFIDIDLNRCPAELNEIISHAVVYDGANMGPNNSDCETYFFVQMLDDREDESGTNVSIDLKSVDYAIKVNESIKECAGFKVDVKNGKLIVIGSTVSNSGTNFIGEYREQLESLSNKIRTQVTMKDMLQIAIPVNNIVFTKDDADVIISSEEGLHPSKDIKEIEKIVGL